MKQIITTTLMVCIFAACAWSQHILSPQKNNSEIPTYFLHKNKHTLKSTNSSKPRLDSTIEYRLDTNTNKLIPNHKQILTYNENNFLNGIIDWELDTSTNEFYSVYKQEMVNDANGNVLTYISSDWDDTNKEFYVINSGELTYNSNNKISKEVTYIWNTKRYKYEYIYDADKMIETKYKWKEYDSTWTLQDKREFIYSAHENITSIIYYNWNKDEAKWILVNKETYVNDEYGNRIQYIHLRLDNTNQLKEVHKIEYTYDNSYSFDDLILPQTNEKEIESLFTHRLTDLTIFIKDSLGDWVEDSQSKYYYSGLTETSISDNQPKNISVHPNPTSQHILITLPHNNISTGHFKLFDNRGSLLISKQISNNEKINTENLTKGIYIYTIHIDGKTKSGKIIKE